MSSAPSSEPHFDNSEPAEARGPELVPTSAINILIVDDDSKNLTVLETVLENPGYRLVRASSGDEALLALIDHEFALLILDIHMPGMTGFELAHMIKKRKKTAHVPIIFLTAYYNEDAHRLEGYDTGAVDYLYKPVDPVVLRSKVAVFAELYRKNRDVAASNLALTDEIERRRRAEAQLLELNRTLEDRVEDRTREIQQQSARLRRANAALEEFAYAASHDLREPLRNVALNAELLHRRHSARLNEEAAGYLETVIDSARRMNQLISGLLEYAQADSPDEPSAVSDAEEALAQVLKNLNRSIQESHASVTHDTLPSVPIKAVHLEQLLQNLIGNALKYRKDGQPARVHVAAIQEGAQWQFSVRDNGIGIAPEYHERVFLLFKRLHGTGEYSGVGMGLAICQRIVERYGGRIWVHSEPGHGATFHFTLPVNTAS